MTDALSFSAWMTQVQQRTETALAHFLPTKTIAPSRLHDAMSYAALGGGKRVRPLLCQAAGLAFAVPETTLDFPACAVEMIHVYSLVHDDLPCMDDDTLRRGKPTCHVEFDEATALLVGDALQSQAFQTLAEAPVEASHKVEMIHLLAQASGSRGMAGGQAIDLAATGQSISLEELEFMHLHKTGALIRAAVLLGAHSAGVDAATLQGLSHFANRIGLLFQVVDDILDVEASTATLGKTAGKDAAQNKSTYVSLLGLSAAKEKAAELQQQAHDALLPFGGGAQRLHELTDYIVERSF